MKDWFKHINDNELDPRLQEFLDYLVGVKASLGGTDQDPEVRKHGLEQFHHALNDIVFTTERALTENKSELRELK